MSKLKQQSRDEKLQHAAHAVDLQDLPLNTIEDYKAYNREARRVGCPVKIPPSNLHKQLKVRFERMDQPENVLKFIVVNQHVEWKGELIPGKTYVLPKPVVDHLDSRSVPIYGEVPVVEDGVTRTETRQIGERSRFMCRVLEEVA